MADQQRWFKLWCSVLTDDDLQSLPPADRWAWAALGAHVKQSGTRGTVVISLLNAALAGALGVPLDQLEAVIRRLPHVTVNGGSVVNERRFSGRPSDNGTLTVTFKNWPKYQEDSTVAERVRRLRSKKRGEEKRELPTAGTPLPPVDNSPTPPARPTLESTPTVAVATSSNSPQRSRADQLAALATASGLTPEQLTAETAKLRSP